MQCLECMLSLPTTTNADSCRLSGVVKTCRYMQPMTTVSSDLLPALVSATMDVYRQVCVCLQGGVLFWLRLAFYLLFVPGVFRRACLGVADSVVS